MVLVLNLMNKNRKTSVLKIRVFKYKSSRKFQKNYFQNFVNFGNPEKKINSFFHNQEDI